MLTALNLSYNKNKMHKILYYWSRNMLNFYFSEEGLGLVSTPYLVYDFPRKMLFMSSPTNWPNLILWLLLLLKILGDNCTKTVCQPSSDVIKFEIYLIFLIKPFQYMTKKSRQKLKYLENEKSFWGKIKGIFNNF